MYGGNRRVSGLRREEVALLAGVSVDYYTRLERGNLTGVSESVLEALARALPLDEAEPDILDGTIQPGRVFDRTVTLDEVPDGYSTMAARTALKVMIRP